MLPIQQGVGLHQPHVRGRVIPMPDTDTAVREADGNATQVLQDVRILVNPLETEPDEPIWEMPMPELIETDIVGL